MNAENVKAMLQQDGYFDAVKLIETLENGISRKAEFLYLKAFAQESDFSGGDLCCEQFRCLWTAYCFHHSMDVDSAEYDADVAELWEIVRQKASDWQSFADFDAFMCWRLV